MLCRSCTSRFSQLYEALMSQNCESISSKMLRNSKLAILCLMFGWIILCKSLPRVLQRPGGGVQMGHNDVTAQWKHKWSKWVKCSTWQQSTAKAPVRPLVPRVTHHNTVLRGSSLCCSWAYERTAHLDTHLRPTSQIPTHTLIMHFYKVYREKHIELQCKVPGNKLNLILMLLCTHIGPMRACMNACVCV